MPTLQLYHVDVFAETRYAGNQLAVIRNAADLSDEEMLKIAKEMNYAETTFILSDEQRDGGYDVRIFTTVSEVPFAGHPTLGTAYVIRHEIMETPAEEVNLNLQVGQIPVTFTNEGIAWMRQNAPQFGAEFNKPVMASVLGIEREEIDPNFPVQSVSTGLPFIMVPLVSQHAVNRAEVDLDRFDALLESTEDSLEANAILVFCTEPKNEENDIHARVFVHYHGAPEDAATGSANGCLAGYLSHHKYFGSDKVDCRVEQGYMIDRPSLLFLRSQLAADSDLEVNVGGNVILIACGELLHGA